MRIFIGRSTLFPDVRRASELRLHTNRNRAFQSPIPSELVSFLLSERGAMVQPGPWIQVVVAASAVLIFLSAVSDDLRRANGELDARKEDWDHEQQRKREVQEAARQTAEAAQAAPPPVPELIPSSQSESEDALPDTAPTPD